MAFLLRQTTTTNAVPFFQGVRTVHWRRSDLAASRDLRRQTKGPNGEDESSTSAPGLWPRVASAHLLHTRGPKFSLFARRSARSPASVRATYSSDDRERTPVAELRGARRKMSAMSSAYV